jgi:energy-coupling factor transport system ATP-binding protein
MAHPVIFSKFSYTYPGTEHPALQIEELEIDAGEFCCLVGPSGAGKSTFCRVLSGLIPHFFHGEMNGSSLVFGEETRTKSIYELAGIVGYVMDDPFDQLTRSTDTVFDEIAFGLQNIGMPADEILQRVGEVMKELEISDLAERVPTQLSGGQQQRVAIASIFARRPDVFVMDEATGQLDPLGAASIYELAKHFKELGKTVIMVEPRLDPVLKYVDRILVLEAGKLVANGTPREILMQGNFERLCLGLPSYSKLAKELAKRGWAQEQAPILLEEARKMVTEALHGSH